ncbi:MAG: type I restriction enzyme HsdR N-terminal domain-containing protein [bacterium]|nr:type I restriction enzyme HsdR N-terminal domain-containing protein [bacterium]
MAGIPQKIVDRYKATIPKFQKVLTEARNRDLNEADTVTIVKDVLADVFGYDKYTEITGEYAIRGTFCDLAVRIDGKVQFLIEVKAIGLDLKEGHLRQAVEYGANQGVPWVMLTNGIRWQLYKLRLDQKVNYDQVLAFDFCALNVRSEDDRDKLFALTKQGLAKSVRENLYERTQLVNRFAIAALIQTDPVVDVIRRELKRSAENLRVENEEIIAILKNEVLKRDAIEGEEATKAMTRIRRSSNKTLRRARQEQEDGVSIPTSETPSSRPEE